MSRALSQMMRSTLRSAKEAHVARSHLFLASGAGLERGRFWAEAMSSDVLVYDFQDGCRPGEEGNVFESIKRSRQVFPGSVCAVRVKELECEYTGESHEPEVLDQIIASLSQPQVRWLQLPMCNTIDDVQQYVDIVNDVDRNWLAEHGQLQIICETPWCQKNLDDVLADHQDVAAVIVGGGDYSRYAQMDLTKMTELLRWDVLNACLRHGRFAIDSPTLGVTTDKSSHFEEGRAAGMRSSLVLHPSLVENCNATFSPSLDEIQRMLPDIDQWMRTGATGYRRGSGADFIGPPHLKQMVWKAKYSGKICSKPTFVKKIDHLLSGLKQSFRFSPSAGSIMDPMLPLLALGASAHPAHHRLIANLGCSECKWGRGSMDEHGNLRPNLLDAAKSVCTNVLHRKMTRAGKMIVTSEVEILDEKHQPQLSYVRKFLEEPTPYDERDDNSWSAEASKAMPMRITASNAIARAGRTVSENVVTAPNEGMHEQFCALLSYDAPLHHTNLPTIPSTLHLACHQIYADDRRSSAKPIHISDVTYHAQLKPNQLCRCTVYRDLDGGKGSYISILRAVDEEMNDAQILSSLLFDTDAVLEEMPLITNALEAPAFVVC